MKPVTPSGFVEIKDCRSTGPVLRPWRRHSPGRYGFLPIEGDHAFNKHHEIVLSEGQVRRVGPKAEPG